MSYYDILICFPHSSTSSRDGPRGATALTNDEPNQEGSWFDRGTELDAKPGGGGGGGGDGHASRHVPGSRIILFPPAGLVFSGVCMPRISLYEYVPLWYLRIRGGDSDSQRLDEEGGGFGWRAELDTKLGGGGGGGGGGRRRRRRASRHALV